MGRHSHPKAAVPLEWDGGWEGQLVSRQGRGLGWGAEGPLPGTGGAPQELTWCPRHPVPCPPWPPRSHLAARNAVASATRPCARSRGARGRRAPRPGHGHSWRPGGAVQGGRRGQEGVGAGGCVGGRGRARERGREGNKRSLCGAAGRRGARYPMPRSHVGNKRTILCLAWKTTWRARDRERVNPMGAGRRSPRPLWEAGGSEGPLGAFPALSPQFPVSQAWSAVGGPRAPRWPLGRGPATLRRGLEPWLPLPGPGQTCDPCLLPASGPAHPTPRAPLHSESWQHRRRS